MKILCKYENQGITINQILIGDGLIKNEKTFKSLLIPLEGLIYLSKIEF